MKIIATDNFARDNVSDFLVCAQVDEYHGKIIEAHLNSLGGENRPHFYRLVPDDHELYTWEP